jgi:hypothetical protein
MTSRSVVIQHDPGRQLRRLLWGCVVLVVVFGGGMVVGAYSSYHLLWSSDGEYGELRDHIGLQEGELESLRHWQAANLTRRDVDAGALEIVRQELASEQEMIAELDRGIRFYKSLMAPGEVAEGLSVRSIDLSDNGKSGRYQFRVLVQQNSRKHALMTGTLNVSIAGMRAGEAVEFDLSELSRQVPKADIRLRFKYFQAIDGELELPEGFDPQLMRVTATSTKPRRSEVSEEFPWAVQEKLNHVGQ